MPYKFLKTVSYLICSCFFAMSWGGTAWAKPSDEASTVTIPLQDYLNLIKEDKKEIQFSSVESVKVSGTYGSDLSIYFVGSSSKNPLEVVVMDYNNNFSIASCKGDAALSLKGSEVVLFPQAQKFKVSCSLKINNWQNLSFNFKKVLTVEMGVAGAESVYEPGRADEQKFAVFPKDRNVASTNEKPSFVSRYHLSLFKDENRFKYSFQIENPNKKAIDYVFKPRETEVVKSVHSSLRYSDKEGGYHFVLPPGTSHIVVDGRFTEGEWTPPMESGLSYLMIDQHPMITAKIETGAKRVSNNTVGIRNSYPNARAYILAAKDQFQWEKSELEAFTASTYTIDQAQYQYYWSKTGQDLVEVTYTINNQGATEIPLKVPGTPTYLAINHRAHVLTKTKNDELLLQVPTGEGQQVLVQYKVKRDQPRFIASNFSDLPKPEATVSTATMSLQLPKSHQPLFFKNGDDWEVFFNFPQLIKAVLLFLLLSFFLKRIQVAPKVSRILAVSLALSSLYFHFLFTWSLYIVFIAWGLSFRDRINIKENFTWKKGLAGFAAFCMLLIVWTVISSHTLGVRSQINHLSARMEAPADNIASYGGSGVGSAMMKRKGMAMPSSPAEDRDYELEESVSSFASLEAQGEPEGDGGDNYQGLPARIQIPREGRQIYLQQGFTEAKRNLNFVAWSLNSWVLKFFNFTLLFFCLFLLWREREKFLIYTKLQSFGSR